MKARTYKDQRFVRWCCRGSFSMLLALIGYWLAGFGLAAGLGLATPLGGVGVWIGLAAGLVVVAALLLWRWHWRERLGLVPA